MKYNIVNKIKKNNKGVTLLMVMSFLGLMVISTGSLVVIMQQDITMIRHIEKKAKSRLMAEAGINHALGKMINEGFNAGIATDFNETLDTGSYAVTFSEISGRHKITSIGTVEVDITGTVEEVTTTSVIEVSDNTPTALNYFSGAGNDLKIYSLVAGASIDGDIHANNNTYLASGPFISYLYITGQVSASGIVKEGSKHNSNSWDWLDNHVYINGDNNDSAEVFEGQPWITFPAFNYDAYKERAIDSGDYYNADHDFNSETLTPDNGIVYVDGVARIYGTCIINGGIIADRIEVRGELQQYETEHNRNVVMAKNGDVQIFGRLYTEKALVYASEDVKSLQIFARIDINGIILAAQDIDMWNFLVLINYNYEYVTPADMSGSGGGEMVEIVSWNR